MVSLDIAGLKIMAGKWTMSGQYDHFVQTNFQLASHFDRSSKLTGKLYFFTLTLEIAKTVKS